VVGGQQLPKSQSYSGKLEEMVCTASVEASTSAEWYLGVQRQATPSSAAFSVWFNGNSARQNASERGKAVLCIKKISAKLKGI